MRPLLYWTASQMAYSLIFSGMGITKTIWNKIICPKIAIQVRMANWLEPFTAPAGICFVVFGSGRLACGAGIRQFQK